tara:strand:- start:362 stop:1210 length:849 start_codon:yes stop_codon:yes gene_type:complete
MDNLGNDLIKLLVTGAKGYLGKQLVDFLRLNYEHVFSISRLKESNHIQCDLINFEEVKNLIFSIKPDLIIHCAATVPKSIDDYNKNIYSNDKKMLSNILIRSRCPLILISSMTVYGKSYQIPVHEEYAGTPKTTYGEMKWDCEKLLLSNNRSGFSLRIPGLFGLPRRSGLIYNILNGVKFHKAITLPNSPILWAALSVRNAVESISKLVESDIDTFKIINLGYPGKHSISLLVDKINILFGSKIKNTIIHPTFEFDLTRAISHEILPLSTLEQELTSFYNQI